MLDPSFSVSQTVSAPNIISLVDTSTGSDSSILTRRVYLRQANGTYIVPIGTTTSYIVWDYSVSFIDIDVLTRDLALDITVEWLDNSNVTQYTKAALYCFTVFSELFYYQLTQDIASNQIQITNQNYYYNKMVLRCCIDQAVNATNYGSDIGNSQLSLDAAYNLYIKQNVFF